MLAVVEKRWQRIRERHSFSAGEKARMRASQKKTNPKRSDDLCEFVLCARRELEGKTLALALVLSPRRGKTFCRLFTKRASDCTGNQWTVIASED